MKATTILLTASLMALAACGDGDFCDVWTGPKAFDRDTAAMMVRTDRDDVEGIATENEYGARHCK